MGTGAFLGALAGAGQGLSDYADNRTKLFNERTLMAERDKMEIERAKTLALFQEEQRNAPLNRFSEILKNKANEKIAVSPDEVTSLGKDSATAIGLGEGMQGSLKGDNDIRIRFKDVLANPSATDEQKQAATAILAQIDEQTKAKGMINQRAVDGQTRSRTNAEAMDAAYQEALMNDPSAAIAMHPIIKDARDTKKLDSEIEDRKNRADRAEKKSDLRLDFDMRKEERLMQYQENMSMQNERIREANTEKEKQQAINAQRAATQSALNSVEKEINANLKELADPVLDDAKKSVINKIQSDLISERKGYRAALASNGFDIPKEEPKLYNIDTLSEAAKQGAIQKAIDNKDTHSDFIKTFGQDAFDKYVRDAKKKSSGSTGSW
jgi:hypothetical protein